MENFKKKINYKSILLIFLSITLFSLIYINKESLVCSYAGDRILDKLLGFNNDCYERKIKGVIFPSQKFYGSRYNIIKNKKEINCPKNTSIIIISGQSNSANFLKGNKKYQNNHINYFNGNCYKLEDPVLGAEGEMSSLAPAIASKLDFKKPVIFLTAGRGGIHIDSASSMDGEFISYHKKSLDYLLKFNNKLKFFIWIHGEANNGDTLNYKSKFILMYENILRGLNKKDKINLIITKTSVCKNERDVILNKIQKEISYKYNEFTELIETDDLNEEFRYDNCHFNFKGIDVISDRISLLINNLNYE